MTSSCRVLALIWVCTLAPACAVLDGLGDDEQPDDGPGAFCAIADGKANGDPCINSSECCSEFCAQGSNVCASPTTYRLTFLPPAPVECPEPIGQLSDAEVLAAPDGSIQYFAAIGLHFMGGLGPGDGFLEAYCVVNQQVQQQAGTIQVSPDGPGRYRGTYDFSPTSGGTGEATIVLVP